MKLKLLDVYHFWFSKKNDYDKWFINSTKYDFYISLPPFIKQNKELESDIIMGDLGNKIKITF